MIVRNQESIRGLAQSPDLVAHMHEVRPGRRLYLTYDLKRAPRHLSKVHGPLIAQRQRHQLAHSGSSSVAARTLHGTTPSQACVGHGMDPASSRAISSPTEMMLMGPDAYRGWRQPVQENTSNQRRTVVVSPPFAAFYQATHIPAARKVGNRLLLTGHTGDTTGAYSDDVKTQLRQTFRNMEATLHEAGASWADVVALNSYHVGLQAQADALLEISAEFLAEPYPAWTAVGVTELIDPPAMVEISCEALLPDDS